VRFDPNSDLQVVLHGASRELLDTHLVAFKVLYFPTASHDCEALEVAEAVECDAFDSALEELVTVTAWWSVSCDVDGLALGWDAVRDDYEIPVASRDAWRDVDGAALQVLGDPSTSSNAHGREIVAPQVDDLAS
jgi:hypothetical protein